MVFVSERATEGWGERSEAGVHSHQESVSAGDVENAVACTAAGGAYQICSGSSRMRLLSQNCSIQLLRKMQASVVLRASLPDERLETA